MGYDIPRAVACVVITTLCCATACLDFKKKSPRDGDLVQVFHYGGPGNDRAMAIAPLDDGGFMMAGIHGGGEVFEGVDFGDPVGDPDAFVARIDRLGSPVWVVNLAASYGSELKRIHPYFVSVDDGGVVVVGARVNGNEVNIELMGSGDALPLDLEYQPPEATVARFMGALVLGFDVADGEPLWQIGNGPAEITAGVSEAGMVYVSGAAESKEPIYLGVDLENENHVLKVKYPADLQCSGPFGRYQFVAAFNVDEGGLCWAVPIVGCSRAFDLDVNDENLTLAGRFEGDAGFVTNPEDLPCDTDSEFTWKCSPGDAGPGWECEVLVAKGSGMDAFTASMDVSDGKVEWARRIGGETGDDCGFRGVYTSNNSVAVAGAFDGTTAVCGNEACTTPAEELETASGNRAVFLAGYSAELGEFLWATYADVVTTFDDGLCKEFAMAAADNGGLVVGGGFSGIATFGPGEPGAVVLESFNSAGDSEPFIARFNPDGTLRWARSECGQNANGAIHAMAPVTLAGEQVFLAAGGFEGTAVFGAGETNQTTLVSEDALPGDQDIFVLQLRDE